MTESIGLATAIIGLVGTFFGAGIVWGITRYTLSETKKQAEKHHKDLYGSNGTPPVFVRRFEYEREQGEIEKSIDRLSHGMDSLKRYARYEMQAKGVALQEIDRILGEE